MSDALDDLRDDYLARIKPAPAVPATTLHPAMRTMLANARRLVGIGDPAAVGGTGLDIGFLLACNESAPDVFVDLVAWRLGGDPASLHARGPVRVAADQGAAARARKHHEYCNGLRTRPLPEAM